MKFLISFRFDNNYFFFLINLISFILIYRYDEKCKKAYVYELANLISILVSLICIIIKKNSAINEKNVISKISRQTGDTLIIYEKTKKKIFNIEFTKGHFIIILIYIFFNIIPFIRGAKIYEIKFLRFLSNTIFLGVFIISIFMKENIYRHHLLSMLSLFLIMFLYPDFIESVKKEGLFINILGTSTYYISRGAMRKYFNYLMLVEYIDPFYISIIDVSAVLLKNIISYIYAYFALNTEDANKVYLKELDLNEFYNSTFLIGFILYYISIIINPIFDILTSYHYSAYHQCLIDILGSFLNSFIIQIEKRISNDEDKQNTKIFIENTLIAIFNIFFAGVMAEIIILNFFDLNKNTKKEIEKRGISEAIENEINKSFDIKTNRSSNVSTESIVSNVSLKTFKE